MILFFMKMCLCKLATLTYNIIYVVLFFQKNVVVDCECISFEELLKKKQGNNP